MSTDCPLIVWPSNSSRALRTCLLMIRRVSTNIATKSHPTESSVSANISTDCRKYVENTQSTKNWPSIDRGLLAYWQTSGGLLSDLHVSRQQPIWADAPLTYRPSSGWYANECRQSIDRLSVDTRPTVPRYISWVSIDTVNRESVDRCLIYTWSDYALIIIGTCMMLIEWKI